MTAFYLIYVSVANEPFFEQEFLDLLKVSHRNNVLNGVTGMLLYKERKFMQLLEGNEEAVRQTYAKILRDPRHRDAVTLLQAMRRSVTSPTGRWPSTIWITTLRGLPGILAVPPN